MFQRGEAGCLERRFFAPGSAIWRVDREMALLLGGGRALLMQIAHPKIAAGVADHSRFQTDPLGRLAQTMETMWSVVFDALPQAQAALERVEKIHRRVHGTVREPGALPPGTPYRARDPELLLWVHATLVDSALVTYGRFVKPLSVEEKRQYYRDTKRLGVLMGVPETKLPDSYEAFDEYVREMIESGAVAVGATARALSREILHPRPWFLKTFAPLHVLITTGLLPPELRRSYGLPGTEGEKGCSGWWPARRGRLFPSSLQSSALCRTRAPRRRALRDLKRRFDPSINSGP